MSVVDEINSRNRYANLKRQAPKRLVSDEGEATCCTCHETKPVTAFSLHRTRPNGRAPQCRSCRSDANAAVRGKYYWTKKKKEFAKWQGMLRPYGVNEGHAKVLS